MILNKEINITLDGNPAVINTNDSVSWIPSVNNNPDVFRAKFKVNVADGMSNNDLAYLGANGRFWLLNDGGVGTYTPYFRGSSLGSTIRFPRGSEVEFEIIETKINDTTYEAVIYNLTRNTSVVRTNATPSFTDGDLVVFGGSYNKYGRMTSTWAEIEVNDDVLNTTQDTFDNQMVTDNGIIATINTRYSINKPVGVNVPNYIDDNDYINTVIRADKVPVLHTNKIYVYGDKVIEGATVTVKELNDTVIKTDTVGDDGEFVFDAYNGDYKFDITATDFISQTDIPINVYLKPTVKRVKMTLVDIPEIDSIKIQLFTKVGTSLTQLKHRLGQFLKKPDGSNWFNTGDGFQKFFGLLSYDYRVYNSIADLKKSPKAKIGDMVKTSSFYDGDLDGGYTYKCVSIDADGDNYINNDFDIIVTSSNDAFQANFAAKGYVYLSNAGIRGDGLVDYKQMQLVCDYASLHRIKIYGGNATKTYILKATSDKERLVINGSDYYNYIDWQGAKVQDFYQAKSMPMTLLEKVEIGTFTSYADTANTVNLAKHKLLTFTSNSNTIQRKIRIVFSEAEFNALTGLAVNDYVLCYFYSTFLDSSSSNSLRKITGISPITYDEDKVADVSSTMRDRFFIANNDFTKRFSIYDDFDNQSNTVIGAVTSKEMFTNGETLYFYNFISERTIAENNADIELDRDLTTFVGESLYRERGTTKWFLYDESKIPKAPIHLKDAKYFKWVNGNFDDERPHQGELDLSISIDDNLTINEDDQVYPLSWRGLIETTGGLKGSDNNSYLEISKSSFSNYNCRYVLQSTGTNYNKLRFTKLRFYDSGGIYVQNDYFGGNVRKSQCTIKDIEVINPYQHQFRSRGVSTRGTKNLISNIFSKHSGLAFIGYSTDVTKASKITFEDCMSKAISTTNPFLNGKSIPIKNGGIRILMLKRGDTGYKRSGFADFKDISIISVSKNKMEVDIDPVTGSFINVDVLPLWFTRQEDGSGNMRLTNCDILGTVSASSHTDLSNGTQQAGSLNMDLINPHIKYHPLLQFSNPSVSADRIINPTVSAIEEQELFQHEYYHDGTISLEGEIINLKSYLGVGTSLRSGHKLGWFTSSSPTDNYDTDQSFERYDIGFGGNYTQRQPIKTETDSAGNIKVVATKADLVNILTTDFGSGFNENYKGGFIEVADESVNINASKTLNQRYINIEHSTVGVSNLDYWTKENHGSNKPYIPTHIKNIKSKSFSLTNLLDKDVKEFKYLENIHNINTFAWSFRKWTGGHGKPIIIFRDSTFKKTTTNITTVTLQFSFLNTFVGDVSGTATYLNQNVDYPVVILYENCKYISTILGENGVGRNETIDIDPSNVYYDQTTNDNWKWVHPQMKNIYLRNTGQPNLDNLYLGHAKDNQELNIIIDGNSPSGAGFSLNGNTYTNKGIYKFKVINTYVEEIYSSSTIELISRPSSNLTGNVLSLNQKEGDNYNFTSGDTRDHAAYTFDNLEVNGWVECFVNKSGSAPTLSDANGTRNLTPVQVGGVPFVADTDMSMLVRYNGVNVEYKFLAR